MKRNSDQLRRGSFGAAIGGILGYLLIQDLSASYIVQATGPVIGAVLGWLLNRSIWAVVLGAIFGWLLIAVAPIVTAGVLAGMVAGVMVSCNLVGRRGRWIILAVVVGLTLVSILRHII